MHERFAAKVARTLQPRFHAQTVGVMLTPQQPQVKLVCSAFRAIAAAPSGTQSLYANALDEA